MYGKSGQARIALVCIAVAFGTATAFCRTSAAERRVTFEPQKDALAVRVEGWPLAIYVYRDPEILRPYFKAIHAPGGIQVSRRHPPREGADPVDHATMHPVLWLAFGDLGGADFWRNKAGVEHVAFVHPPLAEGSQGRFTVRNRYASEGRTICEETCTYTFHVRPAGTLILWESVFQSDESGFYFGDQEEMGLGIRVATPMMVKPYEGRHRPGRILDDLGWRNEKGIWGNQAAWCAYGGWMDNRFVGMMVMPDPRNAQPCRWHTRDYGFMAANPFGHAAFRQGAARKTEVQPGESLSLRFGILIHAGDSEKAVDLNAAYEDYLQVLNTR